MRAERCSAMVQRSTTKKATLLSPSCFVFFFLRYCSAAKTFFYLMWSCIAAFPLHLPAEKLHCKERWNFVLKKKTTGAVTFFALLQGNGEFAFLLWFCCEEGDGNNVVTFLYGGGYYFFFVVAYDVVP
jgi:hypothetical protein